MSMIRTPCKYTTLGEKFKFNGIIDPSLKQIRLRSFPNKHLDEYTHILTLAPEADKKSSLFFGLATSHLLYSYAKKYNFGILNYFLKATSIVLHFTKP